MKNSLYLITGIWLICIIISLYYISSYMFKVSENPQACPIYPNNQQIIFDKTKDNLILFIHPFCPCSHATVNELKRVLAKTNANIAINVVFIKPKGLKSIQQNDLYQEISQIKGVNIIFDRSNVLAGAFNINTSGSILLYDINGNLIFQGGITGGRAEEGDNLGKSRLIQALKNESGKWQSPVFGCSLLTK